MNFQIRDVPCDRPDKEMIQKYFLVVAKKNLNMNQGGVYYVTLTVVLTFS